MNPCVVGLLAHELRNVGVNVAAIQEIRRLKTGEREFRAVELIANALFKYHICYSCHRMKGKFLNYGLISINGLTNDKPDDMKDELYENLDK